MSTGGAVTKPLVANPCLRQWKAGSITSSKIGQGHFHAVENVALFFLHFLFLSFQCAVPYLWLMSLGFQIIFQIPLVLSIIFYKIGQTPFLKGCTQRGHFRALMDFLMGPVGFALTMACGASMIYLTILLLCSNLLSGTAFQSQSWIHQCRSSGYFYQTVVCTQC